LAPADRAQLPNGVYDLGVAHGIAGTLATLGAATPASIAGSRELLEGAIAWLLTQPRPAGGVSRFATWTTGNGADPSARAAWCYGDPGIACALAAASARAGVAAGMAAAVETAHGAALRTPENGRVTDAGLCHGSAGLAVIFARLCETIGGPELHDATRTWLLRTIDYLERDGFAGTSTPQRATCFRGLGLLTGAAGILLDRALGLSIR
jgi:hypothetical protein